MKPFTKFSLAILAAAAFVCCEDKSDPVPEPEPSPVNNDTIVNNDTVTDIDVDTVVIDATYNGIYVDGRYLKSVDGKTLTLHGFAQRRACRRISPNPLKK